MRLPRPKWWALDFSPDAILEASFCRQTRLTGFTPSWRGITSSWRSLSNLTIHRRFSSRQLRRRRHSRRLILFVKTFSTGRQDYDSTTLLRRFIVTLGPLLMHGKVRTVNLPFEGTLQAPHFIQRTWLVHVSRASYSVHSTLPWTRRTRASFAFVNDTIRATDAGTGLALNTA